MAMKQPPAHKMSRGFTLGGDSDRYTDPAYWEGTLGRRVMAYVIDIIVLGFVWMGLGILAILSFGLLAPVTALAWALTPLVYHTFMAHRRGATIGQGVMGLRIVDARTGEKPDLVQALILTVLFYVSLSLAFLPLLYCLFDERDRLLHDILTNTRTIKAEAV
jgi:uncharacterized RDD family membrane protein YckC